MPKEAVFTMKLEPDLREAFMSEAQASHRPASQILRELMREFVQKQRQARALAFMDRREYDDFLTQKVQTARLSMNAGAGMANEAVEAQFAARRAQVTGRA